MIRSTQEMFDAICALFDSADAELDPALAGSFAPMLSGECACPDKRETLRLQLLKN